MQHLRKWNLICFLAAFVLCVGMSAQAAVFNGELTIGDPTFHRPSTNWEPGDPCGPSSTDPPFYYDVYSFTHTGGALRISFSTTGFIPVIIGYAGVCSFNSDRPCDNFVGIFGCGPSDFEWITPQSYPAGDYEIVITSCDTKGTGTYELEATSVSLSVPTTNEWGIIIFVILLAGSAVVMMRKRHPQA
ncbi:MAG: IPTL-CTERM sorting domain-containing protein [Deltaproteobacteria bacterium]|nr:IPTL-CTERM sorting domain-containing protein [Deltaproteobacteria bacterium]